MVQPRRRQAHRLCGIEQNDTANRSGHRPLTPELESFSGGNDVAKAIHSDISYPDSQQPSRTAHNFASHMLIRHCFLFFLPTQSDLPYICHCSSPFFPSSIMTDYTGQHSSGPDATTQAGQSPPSSCEQLSPLPPPPPPPPPPGVGMCSD